MFLEREAVMAQELVTAALKGRPDEVVVGVMGAEHLLRVQEMLQTGCWKEILQRKQQRQHNAAVTERGVCASRRRLILGVGVRATLEFFFIGG